MLAMVAVGAMAITLELRMPLILHPRAQAVPVQGLAGVDFDVIVAALLLPCFQRVDRQDALAPQRALEAGVGAALLGQVAGGLDGVVADRFHGRVGKVHGFVGAVGDACLYSASWKPIRPRPTGRWRILELRACVTE